MSKRNNIIGYSRTSTNPLVNNLVAWYDFNNNALDALGVHNGTEVGSPSYVAGIIDNAINFQNDNTARYVSVNDSADFSFTNGVNDLPFSISLWVNHLSLSSVGNWYINKRNVQTDQNEWQFVYSQSSNSIVFTLFSGGLSTNAITATISGAPSLNTWFHLVCTYDGSGLASGLKIYLNGVDATTSTATIGTYLGMSNTVAPVWIGLLGFAANAGAAKHRGYLDLVGIWKDRELTSADVLELYNSGSGITYPF